MLVLLRSYQACPTTAGTMLVLLLQVPCWSYYCRYHAGPTTVGTMLALRSYHAGPQKLPCWPSEVTMLVLLRNYSRYIMWWLLCWSSAGLCPTSSACWNLWWLVNSVSVCLSVRPCVGRDEWSVFRAVNFGSVDANAKRELDNCGGKMSREEKRFSTHEFLYEKKGTNSFLSVQFYKEVFSVFVRKAPFQSNQRT